MKLTSSIFLALTGTIMAAPTLKSRQNSVSSAINQWLSDINTVNNFLNTVLLADDVDPASFAAATLQTANNEPVQLGILTNLLAASDSAGHANSANLMAMFPGVPQALQNIVDGGDVSENVIAINNLRCGDVLPNIGELWENVSGDNSVPFIGFPPGPFVCPTFNGDVYPIV